MKKLTRKMSVRMIQMMLLYGNLWLVEEAPDCCLRNWTPNVGLRLVDLILAFLATLSGFTLLISTGCFEANVLNDIFRFASNCSYWPSNIKLWRWSITLLLNVSLSTTLSLSTSPSVGVSAFSLNEHFAWFKIASKRMVAVDVRRFQCCAIVLVIKVYITESASETLRSNIDIPNLYAYCILFKYLSSAEHTMTVVNVLCMLVMFVSCRPHIKAAGRAVINENAITATTQAIASRALSCFLNGWHIFLYRSTLMTSKTLAVEAIPNILKKHFTLQASKLGFEK